MDPPIVPRFLTWGSPIPSANLEREGIAFATDFDSATSVCMVVAPIFRDLLLTLIPDSSLIFLISIIAEYEASLSLIAGIV